MMLRIYVYASGQALVETLVALPLLLSVFMCTLYLGRLHDIEARAIATSRYAAFAAAEQLQTQPVIAIDDQAAARVIAPADTPILQNERWDDARWTNYYDSSWTAPTDQRRLIHNRAAVLVHTTNGALDGGVGAAIDAAIVSARTAALLGRGRIDLANDGLISSEVQIAVAPVGSLPRPLDALALRLTSRTSLLANGWGANSTEQAARRIVAMHPTSGVGSLLEYLQPAIWLASVLEPALLHLCVGRVDPDIVPADRLQSARNAESGTWRPRCS
ncbi:MAG: hypothetical protein KDI32_14935 [Pseudomonadales bacterium]|nr:hypothetical protein [Pseudomonadales bacterium]